VNKKIFVFVGGLHKSGTSLLYRCITDHPKVSGFSETGVPEDEGQHLQGLYEPADSFGGPGTFGFDTDSHLSESSRLVSEENAVRLFSEWSEYWDLSKSILAEKSPPNLLRGRFLSALFPETRFIMVIRHPIAVSYATRKWTDLLDCLARRVTDRGLPPMFRSRLPTLKLPIWMLIKHWLVCYEKYKSDKDYIKNTMLLRYENLVKRKTPTMKRVWKFMNLDMHNTNVEVKHGLNEKYFEKWRRDRKSCNIYKNLYAKHAVYKYEDRVRQFGYSLKI